MRVDNALDDVEESQASGFLYQGSSDLEIGNDPEVGGAQYVGLRFQNSPVPRGAQIMGASLMLTIDESFNELEECDVTTHDAMDCRRFNEWMTATIKMRRVGDAPEWLDPDSTDTDVIANRDCSRDPFSGVIDSVCYTNYDCDAISQWKPVKEYIDQHFPSGLESCDFFTKPGGVNGYSLYDAIMTEWPEYPPVSETCSCNNCKCTGLPSPKVLSRSFNEEGTTRSVKWEPGGEHMPHCAGSCPSSRPGCSSRLTSRTCFKRWSTCRATIRATRSPSSSTATRTSTTRPRSARTSRGTAPPPRSTRGRRAGRPSARRSS